MEVSSGEIQFFFEIFLAFEAAILGWYQPGIIKKHIIPLKRLLKRCGDIDVDSITDPKTTKKLIPYIKAAAKDLIKLEKKEIHNNCLIQTGKWVIAIFSLSILLALILLNTPEVSSFIERYISIYFSFYFLFFFCFLFVIIKTIYLHFCVFKFAIDRKKYYKGFFEIWDIAIASEQSNKFNP